MGWVVIILFRKLTVSTIGFGSKTNQVLFQNRRTQLKTQHERADNNALKVENDKIRCENIAIREALKHAMCPNCGGPPVSEDPYFDERKLRIENVHLRDKNVSGCIKVHGKTNLLPPLNATPNAHLTVGSVHEWSSLDFDLLPASSMHSQSNNLATVSDMDKPLMNIALTVMEELLRLFNTNEPLWTRADGGGGRDVLNLMLSFICLQNLTMKPVVVNASSVSKMLKL
ncbi:hypothetical protein DY000_02029525 [Brassica cretica]|uniref:START domain-containing protein n=1 Tax=Brassica cretica TaxID=69181 RepID=A0ABQ7DHV7_BRACR|nr:hypothetical protein DY000_02029525 [Brassica cretica]